MSKTKELYYESAYIKKFEAKVVGCECETTKDGKQIYEIILDQTAFFPEQGGQSSDVGVIAVNESDKDCGNVATINHVSIDKEGVIRHVADKELPVGAKVHGEIDWHHRFSNMQQHTGEHIFSGIVHSKYGFENVGFHLSDSEVTMDYNGVLSADDIRDIEFLVNKAIWENVAIRCEFPTADELKEIDYRSKKELTGDVRIVTVEGYDVCACCAPHVEKTGEIGFLKVVGLQNYKGGVRVNILCGERALSYIQSEHEIVGELSGMLTTSADKIIPSVKKLSEENIALKAELTAVKEKLIDIELSEIDKSLKNVFLLKEAGLDGNVMRKTVNALVAEHSGLCGVFSGDAANGYKFIIGSGADKRDCREAMEVLKTECNAKGGGSPQMVQGSLVTDNIDDILNELTNK